MGEVERDRVLPVEESHQSRSEPACIPERVCLKPGVASAQAASLNPEKLVIVVHEDKRDESAKADGLYQPEGCGS